MERILKLPADGSALPAMTMEVVHHPAFVGAILSWRPLLTSTGYISRETRRGIVNRLRFLHYFEKSEVRKAKLFELISTLDRNIGEEPFLDKKERSDILRELDRVKDYVENKLESDEITATFDSLTVLPRDARYLQCFPTGLRGDWSTCILKAGGDVIEYQLGVRVRVCGRARLDAFLNELERNVQQWKSEGRLDVDWQTAREFIEYSEIDDFVVTEN